MNNFIIVGTQRTGSSALAESIGLNPEVCCGGEFTNPLPYNKKIKVAQQALAGDFSNLTLEGRENIEKNYTLRVNWLGFRWLFSSSKWIFHPRFSLALWLDQMESFISWMLREPTVHIVHIVRDNSLDWLKSIYLARETSLYSKRPYPEGIKIKIPKAGAINRVCAKNWIDTRLSSLKENNPYLQIKYEDFFKDQDVSTATILNFFGCDSTELYSHKRRLKKQSKYGTSDYLLNYDELFKLLSNNGFLFSPFTNK